MFCDKSTFQCHAGGDHAKVAEIWFWGPERETLKTEL